MDEEKEIKAIADYLKALAHPTRIKILMFLMNSTETCVKNLWEELGLQQSNVSQHLALLKKEGIITSRKDGVKTCYRILDDNAVKIINLLKGKGKQQQ